MFTLWLRLSKIVRYMKISILTTLIGWGAVPFNSGAGENEKFKNKGRGADERCVVKVALFFTSGRKLKG